MSFLNFAEFRKRQAIFFSAFFALCASVGLFVAPQMAAAVGITPADIVVDGVLPNSSVERTMNFSRQNPYQNEYGKVEVRGSAAQYIRVPKTLILLPQGENNTPFSFFIEPKTLAAGTYEARISVVPTQATSSTEGGASSVGILAGAEGRVIFTVTSDVKESYTIGQPLFRNTEDHQPVTFGYQVLNVGNVDVQPSRIEIRIVDLSDATHIYTETIKGDSISIAKALVTTNEEIITKASLGIGSYSADVAFYGKTGELKLDAKGLKFQVLPLGTLQQKGELVSFESDKPVYELGEVVRFTALFKNLGTIGFQGNMGIDIMKNDVRVDVLSTDPVFVPIQQISHKFEKDYKPTEPGTYVAVGTVTYGANKTAPIRSEFTVRTQPVATPYMLGALSLLTIFLAIILWLLLRRKRRVVPSAPSAQPQIK